MPTATRRCRAADVAVRIGTAPAAGESYLRGDRVVKAALATVPRRSTRDTDFLSERAAFARAVTDAGQVSSVRAAAIEAWVTARRATDRVVGDVRSCPGHSAASTDRPDDVEAMIAAAERVGFPLLVPRRPVVVRAAAASVGSAVSCPRRWPPAPRRLAAFGDGALFDARDLRLVTSKCTARGRPR